MKTLSQLGYMALCTTVLAAAYPMLAEGRGDTTSSNKSSSTSGAANTSGMSGSTADTSDASSGTGSSNAAGANASGSNTAGSSNAGTSTSSGSTMGSANATVSGSRDNTAASGSLSSNRMNNTGTGVNPAVENAAGSRVAGANDPGMPNNMINEWNAESNYWRDHYSSRPYYRSNRDYSLYEPAYRYGVTVYNQNPGRRYQELDQAQLRRDWENARGTSNLSWEEAQLATRDAYNRLYENERRSNPNGMSSRNVN